MNKNVVFTAMLVVVMVDLGATVAQLGYERCLYEQSKQLGLMICYGCLLDWPMEYIIYELEGLLVVLVVVGLICVLVSLPFNIQDCILFIFK